MTKWIYAVYFAGLALWQFPLLYSLYLTVRNRIQIRRNLKHMTDDERLKQYGSFSEHVNIAIEGADMKKFSIIQKPFTWLVQYSLSERRPLQLWW